MSVPIRTMTPEAAAALRRAAVALAEEYALHEATRFLIVPAGDVVALFQELDAERAKSTEITMMLHAEGMRLQAAKGEVAKVRQARDVEGRIIDGPLICAVLDESNRARADEKPLLVNDLVRILVEFPQNACVVLAGCDCEGAAGSVEALPEKTGMAPAILIRRHLDYLSGGRPNASLTGHLPEGES